MKNRLVRLKETRLELYAMLDKMTHWEDPCNDPYLTKRLEEASNALESCINAYDAEIIRITSE